MLKVIYFVFLKSKYQYIRVYQYIFIFDYIFINYTYKITLICVFLLILLFFKVFPNISIIFEQFLPY